MPEQPPDASASPQQLRSIFDRMTKPTPEDLQVNERLRNLGRGEIDRIMDHFGLALKHLAAQREDLEVESSKTATSWTLHVELKPNVPSPLQFGTVSKSD